MPALLYTLFFDDLLDAKVWEFNPRYGEAEGAVDATVAGALDPAPTRGFCGTVHGQRGSTSGPRRFLSTKLPACLSSRPSSALRQQSRSLAMLLLSRLEDERDPYALG